ncbi:MAG: bifunctional phosphoribosyl-AMP cyclohydrolase/phosphoribosyl-ATP diphosphatase HisIE [Christensenellaceae bacterium]|nr:bifunctional phosphoribosyl-AMP cyclohydrolase/phosphoribosyl-ATP diphosphatase HisIE [Christensenellaceae bacterium]
MQLDMNNIKFDEKGLVSVVVQDADTSAVLMLAYMNEESLKLTLETGYMTYFSRSRQQLWKKGETSGHVQKVVTLAYDCDGDAILAKVKQTGPACHTGSYSCFFNEFFRNGQESVGSGILDELFAVITDRKNNPKEGSYTNYLFDKGIDKTLKKVGEEAAEVIIAAKNPDCSELRWEAADLLYHLMVLIAQKDMLPGEIYAELAGRR